MTTGLEDPTSLTYSIFRITTLGAFPTVVKIGLESYGVSETLTKVIFFTSTVATQAFIQMRTSDPEESRLALKHSIYTNLGALMGVLYSYPVRFIISAPAGALIGSLSTSAVVVEDFVKAHDRRIASRHVEVIQQ